jgi:CubicO group peptidase (beta-lactamase class C family)
MPGCVLAIGRRSELVWLKAYGQRQVEPIAESMTTETVFDLASLTKPIATATCIMLLVERGKLRLNDRVAQHWPEFGVDKEDITIEHLMLHVGGLIADNKLADYLSGPEVAWKNIAGLKPLAPPHERFIYSDVGFLVLGHVVERVTGRSVADFARSAIFEPLGMRTTSYQPVPELRVRIAPTEKRSGQFIRGEVHDPRAYQLGGVAGHAGLFSTARDLARYAAMMSQRGRWKEGTILREDTWEEMTRPREVPRGRRSLGWDNYSPYSSNRGTWMSTMAFGHGGFTGTALWIDPESGLFVIFLSNRLHPDGKGAVNPIAGQIGTIASGAIIRR